jgi:alkanesulfonate monooxygenase SsuD/methylene tetrahydromethanopterin reductase-like flavin-dependent oxidoreductase (luciferase family)
MTSKFRLGFMTHLEGDGDPRRIYAESLELFVAAEQLGFDSVWVAQHHFKSYAGRLPSPLPFLAAAAQKTRRLRLGTALVVLPLEESLRLAEDAAVVDALSNGRLELGVGSGGDPDEFAAFGRALDTRHTRTSAGIDLLRRALAGKALDERGQQLQPPAPTLVDRLWQSAVSEAGACYVADNGAGLLLARVAFKTGWRTDELQLPAVQAFLRAWNGRVLPQRIGLSRSIYPAADKRTALAGLRDDVLRSENGLTVQDQLPSGQSLEAYCEHLNITYGHPDQVAATLRSDCVLPHATDLILQFNPAVPPLDLALRMLEQVATEIAPQLGWRPSMLEPSPYSLV